MKYILDINLLCGGVEDRAAVIEMLLDYYPVIKLSDWYLLIPNGQVILVPAEPNLEVVVLNNDLVNCLACC